MSDSSPLRDPVFLLTWQVHLAVVTLFVLLGIWAGMTRRPWYVAPTLFLGLLWFFVPLEAPEPVVVLLLTVPVLAVACRIARRWLEKRPQESSEISPSRLRFSLGDLLWLTLAVGMLTALLIQVWRMPWKIHWPDIALSAACFCVLGVTTLLATHQTAWKRRLLAVTVLIAVIGAAGWTHQLLLEKDWLLLSEWETLAGLPPALRPFAKLDPFPVYLLTFVQCAVLGLGLRVLLPSPAGRSPSRTSMVLKIAGGSLLLAFLLGLGWVYVGMLDRPSPPEEQWPEVNEREAFWAVLERHRQLNRQYGTRDELPVSKGPAAELAVGEILTELDEILQRGNISQFDSRFDRPDHETNLTSLNYARSMARALMAQARTDWQAGRRTEALAHHFRCLRLAEALQRRSILNDSLLGTGVEAMSFLHLAEVRAELTFEENQKLAGFLADLSGKREPLDLLLARDRFFEDRAGGWRWRVFKVAGQLLGSERYPQSAVPAFHRRDTMLSLVQADLAIRRYQQRHGEWPESLARLVPNELELIPDDPFSEKPLVYRIAGDGFVLYSVGLDGVDDGGKFGKFPSDRTPGYDLGLETWLREN